MIAGQTATFSVSATGTAPLSYQWQKNQANIAGATSASYTTPTLTLADSGETFRVTVTNSAGSMASNPAALTVSAVVAGATDVTTYHNDVARTGQNLTETTLTTANVNSQTFGLLRNLLVDGKVDAEPLYLSQLSVSGSAAQRLYSSPRSTIRFTPSIPIPERSFGKSPCSATARPPAMPAAAAR